jgi:hypothetical protein
MKITSKATNIYGYAAIAVMAVLLLLVALKLVPYSWQMPLFGIALALYLVRITLRLVLARQARMEAKGKDGAGDGPSGQDTNA